MTTTERPISCSMYFNTSFLIYLHLDVSPQGSDQYLAQCTYILTHLHTCPMSFQSWFITTTLCSVSCILIYVDHVVYPDICWPRVSWYMFSSCGRWLTNASIVWSSIGLTELMDEPIHPHYWFPPPILSIMLISIGIISNKIFFININISIILVYQLTELNYIQFDSLRLA